MLQSLKELYLLMEPAHRRRLLLLQLLVLTMSLAEVVSVLSIGPFVGLVSNLDQLQGSSMLADIYRWSGAATPNEFVFWVGGTSLLSLTFAATVSMYTLWKLTIYGQVVGAQLGSRLYAHYMGQPWLFHASVNSSQLINKIAQEVQRVTQGIINPFMMLNAKLVMSSVMGLAIFTYDPVAAVLGIFLFATAYGVIYTLVRRRLTVNGKKSSEYQALRYKLMAEGFGGIKDTLLLGRQRNFIQRFDIASQEVALGIGRNQVISQVPRYAVELIAFGAVIVLVMYLAIAHQGNASLIFPTLSIYALAGIKLLPGFQQAYTSITNIRGTLPALSNVRDDLRQSLATAAASLASSSAPTDRHSLKRAIELKSITFKYPGAEKAALNGLTISIPARKIIGLVGASGSGKSTAIDILLALVPPDRGQLLIDGTPLDAGRMRAWQNSLGFVAQSIFLADTSIMENIAFGLPPEEIDEAKVRQAASMAHLDDLIAELPDRIHTVVGERGVQLSGGQRQRIGIARALYHDAEVLVLDEATSALDGITERLVMDAIHDFGRTKTIVMIAHRLTTVRKCDWIYVIDKGVVVDEGDYDTLMDRNIMFKRMANHA